MALVLHPPDLFNESFLKKIRDCVLKMQEGHPLKRWLKSVSSAENQKAKTEEVQAFLSEILDSHFNLIMDAPIKNKIIKLLAEIPEKTLGERLLKAYLYLIIGNITRSDNLLKEYIRHPPIENWRGHSPHVSVYHGVAKDQLERILLKISKHPIDRSTYNLFSKYVMSFFNDPVLTSLVSPNARLLGDKINLKFMEKLSPPLVRHLRLARDPEAVRMVKFRNLTEYPLEEQLFWHWDFLNADPMISSDMLSVLGKIESTNLIWFIYLMDNDRLGEIYLKEYGVNFLPVGRKHLKALLGRGEEDFMLALFKLIELGDIDGELVSKTVDFFGHE